MVKYVTLPDFCNGNICEFSGNNNQIRWLTSVKQADLCDLLLSDQFLASCYMTLLIFESMSSSWLLFFCFFCHVSKMFIIICIAEIIFSQINITQYN